jgi:hypothetical protein
MQKMTHHVILATSWDATAQPDLPTEVELRDFREEPFAQILRFVLANFSERRRRVPLLHPRSTKASGVCALARTARTQHYQFAPALRIGANPSLADLHRHHLSPSDLPRKLLFLPRRIIYVCVITSSGAGKIPTLRLTCQFCQPDNPLWRKRVSCFRYEAAGYSVLHKRCPTGCSGRLCRAMISS